MKEDFYNNDEESHKQEERMEMFEADGRSNILKHFDRIHDNLFNYNNLLIGGFFALSQFQENVSKWTILIPVANLWFLIWIEYRMMGLSRFQAMITKKTSAEQIKFGRSINRTNLISLLSIMTTAAVTLFFIYCNLKFEFTNLTEKE
jgi:hypothetical protein